ncbi:Ig-like domain-containing protein [Brevibacillus choshinensis]|uniref:Ig-like domain-containing protein n=1 Tax=Brevibacillus choshinensis TaxID=54911 RepID=UPI002E1C5227|nr:Ig-like domain-containing protein [Brevibacillus choshinensis]
MVSPSDITKLTVGETRVSLSVGNKKELSLKATIGKKTSIEANTRATWTSADPTVAEVKDGQLIAKKKGTTVVTAELGSKKVQIKVEVKEKIVKSMKASKTKVILNAGEQYQVQVIATYSDKTTENFTSLVRWSAGSGNAATVENGLITAIAKGKETIKGIYGKKSVSIAVTVK